METLSDESFGVVPVYKNGSDWEVLLINQISYQGGKNSFWTFPKGHPDPNETPLQTAKRELLEETSITYVRIIEDAGFSIKYSFTHEGQRIKKTVTYYLGICSDKAATITIPKEIAELTWCSFAEAAKKLSHKNTQTVLTAAGQYLTSHANLL